MMKEERLENTILRNLLTNEQYTRKALPFLKESYFDLDAEKIVFDQIRDYVDKYNNVPTKEALVIDLNDKKGITEEEFKSSSELLNQVLENDVFNCIPESTTIQNIIGFLCPLFLKTKEEVKY